MNRSFITLHNIFPWKITVLQLSLPDFTIMLSAHLILPWRRVPHCCLPMASRWSFLQCRTRNSMSPTAANLPDPTHPIPKSTWGQEPQGACQTQRKAAGGLGKRRRDYCKQLTGEQSTVPADPLSPTAGNGWCTALPLLTQPRLVAPWYLLVNKCSRAIRCLCLLNWEVNSLGRLLYHAFMMKCLAWQAIRARKCSSDNSNTHLSNPRAEDSQTYETSFNFNRENTFLCYRNKTHYLGGGEKKVFYRYVLWLCTSVLRKVNNPASLILCIKSIVSQSCSNKVTESRTWVLCSNP